MSIFQSRKRFLHHIQINSVCRSDNLFENCDCHKGDLVASVTHEGILYNIDVSENHENGELVIRAESKDGYIETISGVKSKPSGIMKTVLRALTDFLEVQEQQRSQLRRLKVKNTKGLRNKAKVQLKNKQTKSVKYKGSTLLVPLCLLPVTKGRGTKIENKIFNELFD